METAAFAQYDWRVRSWMTLNLGVRYDYFGQFSEADNQISNVDLAAGKVLVAGRDTSATAGLTIRNDGAMIVINAVGLVFRKSRKA